MSTYETIRAVADASCWKSPATTVALVNVTLSGVQNITGHTGAERDTVLCTAQTDGTENGPYVMTSGAWRRRADMNATTDQIAGARVPILSGTEAGAVYRCSNTSAVTIGTTSITWVDARTDGSGITDLDPATALAIGTVNQTGLTAGRAGATTALAGSTLTATAAAALALNGGTTATLDAATIAHLDAGTRLRLTASGGSVEIIGPSQADQIETLLATYDRLLLLPGTYAPSAQIDVPSGKSLIAPWGRAVIVPGWTPVVGDADLTTNCVIGARATLSATTTTLTGNHQEGSDALVVGSTTGMSAGSCLYLSGNNSAANDSLGMSDGANTFVREVVEVASVDSGTGVTLKAPLTKHHATGRTITLLTTRPTDVTIRGIDIRAPGGTIAVGISLLYARNVTIEDCAFEGLSRACIDGLTSREVHARRIHSYGEVNSILLLDNCDDSDASDVTSSQVGLRQHANGIPRGLWTIYGRCVRTTIRDSNLIHANIGIRQWGGHYCGVEDCTVADMISTAALARDPILSTGFLANGFDSAPGPVDDAQFSMGCWIRGLTIVDCHSPVYRHFDVAQPVWACNLHDMLSFSVTGLSIQNRTISTDTKMHGLHMQDCRGTINGLNIQGCWDAISTLGNYEDVDIYGCIINAQPGSASPYLPLFALYINGAATGGAFRLHGAKINGYANFWVIGTAAAASPDLHLEWTDFQLGDVCRAERVILARRIAATTPTEYPAGSICELDPTQSTASVRAVIDTQDAGALVGMVCGEEAYLTGFLFFAPFPQVCRGAKVDGATVMGAQLEPAGRSLTTLSAGTAVARALSETTGAGTLMIGGRQ